MQKKDSGFVTIPGFDRYSINHKGEVWSERSQCVINQKDIHWTKLLNVNNSVCQYPTDLLLILAGFTPKTFCYKAYAKALKEAFNAKSTC